MQCLNSEEISLLCVGYNDPYCLVKVGSFMSDKPFIVADDLSKLGLMKFISSRGDHPGRSYDTYQVTPKGVAAAYLSMNKHPATAIIDHAQFEDYLHRAITKSLPQ